MPAGSLLVAALLLKNEDLFYWAGTLQGVATAVFAREVAHFQIEEMGMWGFGDVETTAFFGRIIGVFVAVVFALGALGLR